MRDASRWGRSSFRALGLMGLAAALQLRAEVLGAEEDRLWSPVRQAALEAAPGWRSISPERSQTLRLNRDALTALLDQAPLESGGRIGADAPVMELPWPDGRFKRFRIEESPIMEPALATQFPELKTYRGQGLDEPAASLRFDWTPAGFHAIVHSPEGTVFVDPWAPGNTADYVVYYKRDYQRTGGTPFRCLVEGEAVGEMAGDVVPVLQPPHGSTGRIYRLAVAATGEYTLFHGGATGAMNAIVTTINRVNSIYILEFAVALQLVANNQLVIFTNPLTDGYDNGADGVGVQMVVRNQFVLDALIGAPNYDIGHVLGTGGIGLGYGPACNSAQKGMGATGGPQPRGDAFDVDFVAHELGHQLGGHHTFNATTGGCTFDGTRTAATAFEPGSGSTIMSYAGLCGAENLQPHSDPYFHGISLEEIIAFITNPAKGDSCGTRVATDNAPPSVNAGPDFTIPSRTPFTLTATGSDPDNDPLTFAWEEMDLGSPSPPSTDDGTRPIFRSFPPKSSPSRTFPKVSDVLSNTASFGESLPTTTRTMRLRATARDNWTGGGGTAGDEMLLRVRGDSGPFLVTRPNTGLTLRAGSTQTVLWDPAGTAGPPVSCANVKISLSTDGGTSFPFVLAASTPNDGTENVVLPAVVTSSARVKIEAVGNVFFDVSDANFTIVPGISVNDIAFAEGNGGSTATFTLSLNAPSPQTVTVSYTTADGTATVGNDYALAQGSLTFAPGVTSRPINVGIVGDTVGEPNETLFVNLTDPVNARIGDAQGQATILNDDPPSVSISDAGISEGATGSRSMVFTVSLSVPAAGTVSVGFTTFGETATTGSDYLFNSGTLFFAPGDTSKTISVSVLGDLTRESNETFVVNLHSPVGVNILDGQGRGTIVDDEGRGSDFDGDGKPDLLFQNQVTAQLVVWFMDGVTRTSGAAVSRTPLTPLWKAVDASDFNGDGKPDILFQEQSSAQLVVWYMDGVTRTGGAAVSRIPASPSWKASAIADFNQDGKPDLLFQNQDTGDLVAWYMDGVTRTAGTALVPGQIADTSWKVAGAADFNADGKPDLVIQNRAGGDLTVWYMDGVTRTSTTALTPPRVLDTNWLVVAP